MLTGGATTTSTPEAAISDRRLIVLGIGGFPRVPSFAALYQAV
jgi:hypothetical protein